MRRKQPLQPYQTAKGLSLIETFLVLAVACLVVVVSVFSYQRYTLNVYRQDVVTYMSHLQQQLAYQYALNNGSYHYLNEAKKPSENIGNCEIPSYFTSGTPPYYRITIDISDDAQSYNITANACAKTGQTADRCGNLRIDNNNVRQIQRTADIYNEPNNTANNRTWIEDNTCF